MNFTNQQLEAINHFKGPSLLLAVPGSGKTTVLINRIYKLITEKNINPSQILSITFSKNQAIDMKIRFNKIYPEFRDTMSFKTIHSFCYEIVQMYTKYKNIKKFLIEGSCNLNKNILLKREFFSKYSKKISDDELSDFFSIYDFIKNKMLDFKTHIKTNKLIPNRVLMDTLYELYENMKIQNNYIDFNDILILANEYINEDPNLLKSIKKRYKFFQIDEGQDTSTIQFETIKKIAYPENNIFIVADDDQSIYSFRGASPENLLNFNKFYPNAKIFIMDKNFRSTKNIIKISNNITRMKKTLK